MALFRLLSALAGMCAFPRVFHGAPGELFLLDGDVIQQQPLQRPDIAPGTRLHGAAYEIRASQPVTITGMLLKRLEVGCRLNGLPLALEGAKNVLCPGHARI